MNKLQQIRNKGVTTLIAISIIGIAVYLGFTPLFEKVQGGVAGAVLGASFGAIFVIVLTMYLLNKQTEIEQESKRGEKVFEEKMKIYWKIFDETEAMLDDGKISKEVEMKKLPFVMTRLITIGSDEVIKSYQKIYDQFNKIFEGEPKEDNVEINKDQTESLMLSLAKFANTCRVDLGVSDYEISDKLFKKTTGSINKSSTILRRNVEIQDNDPNNKFWGSEEAKLSDGEYLIKRYQKGNIRIYIDGKYDEEMAVIPVLRKIDRELDLNIEDKKWSQTQNAGRAVIAKLEERRLKDKK